MTTWQNRIVRHADEAPDQLAAHAFNWRIHPRYQQDAMRDVLKSVGVLKPVIVSERSGYVLNGHMRVMLAITDGQPTIPVTYVNVSEAEEAFILSTFDELAGMAGTDQAALSRLLADVQTDSDAIRELLNGLAETPDAAPFEPGEQTGGGVEGDTMIRVGAYRLRIPQERFTAWYSALVVKTGGSPDALRIELSARLGLPGESDDLE